MSTGFYLDEFHGGNIKLKSHTNVKKIEKPENSGIGYLKTQVCKPENSGGGKFGKVGKKAIEFGPILFPKQSAS